MGAIADRVDCFPPFIVGWIDVRFTGVTPPVDIVSVVKPDKK